MPVLAGVLRAARALSFEAQRKWAERILRRMWSKAPTKNPIPHAAVALSLVHTCGLRVVQKRVSYELLRMPTFFKAIVAALAADEEVQEDSPADAGAEMGLDEVPRAVLLRLLHAREQLVVAWAEIARKAPVDFVCPLQFPLFTKRGRISIGDRSLNCASADVNRVRALWTELVHTSGMYTQLMADPMLGLQTLIEFPWAKEGFCEKCVAMRVEAWKELRNKLWDNLDVWLELTAAEDA